MASAGEDVSPRFSEDWYLPALPNLSVFGCRGGTVHRHIEAIAEAAGVP